MVVVLDTEATGVEDQATVTMAVVAMAVVAMAVVVEDMEVAAAIMTTIMAMETLVVRCCFQDSFNIQLKVWIFLFIFVIDLHLMHR